MEISVKKNFREFLFLDLNLTGIHSYEVLVDVHKDRADNRIPARGSLPVSLCDTVEGGLKSDSPTQHLTGTDRNPRFYSQIEI